MNPTDSTPQTQPSPKQARGINENRAGDKLSISPNNFYGSPMPMGSPKPIMAAPMNPVKGPAGRTVNENLRGLTNKNK